MVSLVVLVLDPLHYGLLQLSQRDQSENLLSIGRLFFLYLNLLLCRHMHSSPTSSELSGPSFAYTNQNILTYFMLTYNPDRVVEWLS